jgi:hypothetical protein
VTAAQNFTKPLYLTDIPEAKWLEMLMDAGRSFFFAGWRHNDTRGRNQAVARRLV